MYAALWTVFLSGHVIVCSVKSCNKCSKLSFLASTQAHNRFATRLLPGRQYIVESQPQNLSFVCAKPLINKIKQDSGRKSDFFTLPAFNAPLGGGGSVRILPYGLTRTVWLPDSEKGLMKCLTVSIQYRHVTDRQTDGRTDILWQHSPYYAVKTDSNLEKCSKYTRSISTTWALVARITPAINFRNLKIITSSTQADWM